MFGLIDPEVLDNNLEIIVGKIDQMEKLKHSDIEPTAYYLHDKYLIHIENPNAKKLNFITLLQNKKLGEKIFAVRQSGLSRIIR